MDNQDQEDHQDLMGKKESQELMVMADHGSGKYLSTIINILFVVDHPDQKDHLDLTENQAQTVKYFNLIV